METASSVVVNLGRLSGYQASPYWTFGSKHKNKRAESNTTPGPLTYTLPAPHLFAYSMSPRQVSFAKAARASRRRVPRTPAPGTYNVPSAFSEKKTAGPALKGRVKEPKSSVTVGPGAYNLTLDRSNSLRGGYIGRSTRASRGLRSSLGPGSYNITPTEETTKVPSGFSFPKAKRAIKAQTSDTPAPGAYDLSGKSGMTQGISFKGCRDDLKLRKSTTDRLGVVFSSFSRPTHTKLHSR